MCTLGKFTLFYAEKVFSPEIKPSNFLYLACGSILFCYYHNLFPSRLFLLCKEFVFGTSTNVDLWKNWSPCSKFHNQNLGFPYVSLSIYPSARRIGISLIFSVLSKQIYEKPPYMQTPIPNQCDSDSHLSVLLSESWNFFFFFYCSFSLSWVISVLTGSPWSMAYSQLAHLDFWWSCLYVHCLALTFYS